MQSRRPARRMAENGATPLGRHRALRQDSAEQTRDAGLRRRVPGRRRPIGCAKPATWASFSSTPSPCRSRCLGNNRRCCRSSTNRSKAKRFRSTTPAVQPKHPLSGLRLKNSTDLHLMQGPITVFDGGAYAGDAKIEDLQPGTERLHQLRARSRHRSRPRRPRRTAAVDRHGVQKGVMFD